jgi:hypothetical protein
MLHGRSGGDDRLRYGALSESQASDQTIMSIAGHVSKRMLEHYSRIRTDAKRTALAAIAPGSKQTIFWVGVHQNVHQLEEIVSDASAKQLNWLVDVTGIEPVTPCLQSKSKFNLSRCRGCA